MRYKATFTVILFCFITSLLFFNYPIGTAEAKSDTAKIVIWTAGEDYRNDFYLNKLKEKFPNYTFVLEYMNSSTIAAKIMGEKLNTQCDIVLSEEYGYLEMCSEYLAELPDFKYSLFMPEIIPQNKKYTPELRNGGAVILNKAVLEKKGVPIPKSYSDLLKPEYKNLVIMPNPKSSGTGYMFLRQLTNEWGENEAFKFFEALTENILQYTSSGSGPVNALVQGEAAIGLGMTAQAVTEINKGAKLDIVFFKEGSPYSMYGNAIIKNKADKKGVKEVFNYLSVDLCKENNNLFFPEQVFKNYTPTIKNYPTKIHYGNMKNNTLQEKERLLKKWMFS